MHPFPPAKTPRILWVELTSKCPFDCVFCSRKTLRGTGEHMPFELFESLVRQVSDPRIFLLNYSGESTIYPHLIPAIRLARSTGAFVELVSALAAVPESTLADLAGCGLSRLTVSLHATDSKLYSESYRYASFEALRARLERFLELCRGVAGPPLVDLAFVAMDQNLSQLQVVGRFASSLGLRNISVFPVIRRDEIPVAFSREFEAAGVYRPRFEENVRSAVDQARQANPEITFTVCNPSFTGGGQCLGEVPLPYPGRLPAVARIHSCEQNPWETAHVLSNGDVVACETHDKTPLGNIARQTLVEIWEGAGYRQFRRRYRRGEIPECSSCPWKRAYVPGPLESEIIASRGGSAQLLYGWHEPSGEAHVWSSQQATAVLAPHSGSGAVWVSGVLPPGCGGEPNELTIRCNARHAGTIVNASESMMPFGLALPVEDRSAAWLIEFHTRHLYRPSERGAGPDRRDLGFALETLAAKHLPNPEAVRRQRSDLDALRNAIAKVDFLARRIARIGRHHTGRSSGDFRPGLTVVIPEWDNHRELANCLDALDRAAREWTEPIEMIVVVNGSQASAYDELRSSFAAVRWEFHKEPLGFSGAVEAGLRKARFDWVYLLNSDVTLDRGALQAAGACRDKSIFAVASQIRLKDPTRFRDETNWTALLLEKGVATIHDRIPQSDATVDNFYAGGGASLFRAGLLRAFLDSSAYKPFYWEDVEWGWRARKLGLRNLFCARSVAYHSRRSTIGRHYSADEIEAILERNRFLFHFRNFTAPGAVDAAIQALSRSPRSVASHFLKPRTLWDISRGRLWNHLTSISDEAVLASSP